MKIFLGASCLLLLSACKQTVETTQPLVQNITESVYASGKVKSKDQYEVYSSVNGIIREVKVTEGELVKKGDVLMTLINDAALLNKENARLSADYQSLYSNQDKLHEAQANIQLAKSKLQNDSLLLQRQRTLWTNDIGSRNELEQRELAFANSGTAYRTAVLRYRQLKQQLELGDKQTKTALQISTVATNDYSIKAKQDGKVYAVSKEAGEIVTAQSPVAILGSAKDFILELQVDEYDIAKITLGQKVFITMDSYKGNVFEALVSKIDPYMNERSRSITIEALFTKQPPEILPNLNAEANILIRTKQNALTIPRSYLLDDMYVLLQSGKRKRVTTGLKDYERVEITNGLTAADVLKKPSE